MFQRKVLFIGKIWPEPNSTAAGKRTMQLVDFFIRLNCKITFASTASKSEFSADLNSLNIEEIPIQLNDSSFDEFIQKLQPDVVIFDRFMTEEQFGWRVRENSPKSIQILDTQDLHFLREARIQAKKKNLELNLYNDLTKREIASIYRSDLTLLISEYELKLLQKKFNIPNSILCYTPFLENKISTENIQNWKNFNERKDFIFIGTFQHEPNYQCVLKLKTEIWPELRKKLPQAKLHIYGSYPTQKVLQLNNSNENFLVHGRAENAPEVISQAKVLLAPIEMGAGQKGKFIDAMQVGTPVVTTSIGAESMYKKDWAGLIAGNNEDFVNSAIELYQNQALWEKSQKNGIEILNELFDRTSHENHLIEKIQKIYQDLTDHRNQNIVGEILHQNQNNVLKYMSLWIEAKNKS